MNTFTPPTANLQDVVDQWFAKNWSLYESQPTVWWSMVDACETDEQFQKVLSKNPPLSFFVAYLDRKWPGQINHSVIPAILDYGKKPLLDLLRTHYNQYLFALHWVHQNKKVWQRMEKYGADILQKDNGVYCFTSILRGLSVKVASSIVSHPNCAFEIDAVLDAFAQSAKPVGPHYKGIYRNYEKSIRLLLDTLTPSQREQWLNKPIGGASTVKMTLNTMFPNMYAKMVKPQVEFDFWRVFRSEISLKNVKLLIENKAVTARVDKLFNGQNLLQRSARTGVPGAIPLLIDAGSDPFCRTMDSDTLAHLAVTSGSAKTLQAVLNAGVNPWLFNHNQDALHLAVEQCDLGMVKILVQQPHFDPTRCNKVGHSYLEKLPIHFAGYIDFQKRIVDVFNCLLQHNVSPFNAEGKSFTEGVNCISGDGKQAVLNALNKSIEQYKVSKQAYAITSAVYDTAPPLTTARKRKM